jgi:predicted ATP-dependent serine protease
MYRCLDCSKTYRGPIGECPCGSRRIQTVREGLVNREPAMLAFELVSQTIPPPFLMGEPILDAALSNGVQPGFSILLSGGEGSGKSTLATQACSAFTKAHGGKALYATSEEDRRNVADRMQRLGLSLDHTYIMSDTMGEAIFTEAGNKGLLLIVDSVSGYSYRDQSCEFGPSAVALAKDVHRWAHANQAIAILICQANKDGDQVGPRALAHCVDATLTIWKSPTSHILVTGKNRRGRAPINQFITLDDRGVHVQSEG